MRRADVAPAVDDGFLAIDGRASVLTLDGRASVITKDCNLPVSDVTSKYICPWTSRIPAVVCRRHRTAWDLCGLVIILLLCLVLILILCFLHPCLFHKNVVTDHGSKEKKLCVTADCVQTAASLLSAMDLQADPCHDFFQYACGTWNKRHVIPEDRSSISTFEVLADQLQIILKGLLETPILPEDQKMAREVKNLYQSCVNISQINVIGEKPLRYVLLLCRLFFFHNQMYLIFFS